MRKLATIVILVSAAVLSAASAQQQQQQAAPVPYGQDPSGCDLVCNHYLECKGIHDNAMYTECIGGCQARMYDRQAATQYAQMDCASAVQVVEAGSQGGGGGVQAGAGGQGGGPRPGDKECQGCKKWDNLCQYVVETAVGSGPYSGMVTDCPQTCCP